MRVQMTFCYVPDVPDEMVTINVPHVEVNSNT